MEYLITHVHPESIKNNLRFLPKFYGNQNHHQTLAFVQYTKLGKDQHYSPSISFTKPSRLPDKQILWLTCETKDFGKMSKKIEQIVKMDEFKLKHFKRFQQLTNREMKVLKLLANGCNNPQIAERLFISRKTVETHRKHIKRKLQIHSFRDLMRYAFAFDLIEC
jgi:DNA-binding CsgD family transcriptional regulator